ncbi:protein of unknown function [Methylocaldum szegediense]|uniref:Uncharacterized protein n=1 Tax=Methylocaldum szegediense TaxID=73780 RepID=A0ABN8WYI1_9GAMM|nr:protein of unknown function [Methylocaldum szegediense]
MLASSILAINSRGCPGIRGVQKLLQRSSRRDHRSAGALSSPVAVASVLVPKACRESSIQCSQFFRCAASQKSAQLGEVDGASRLSALVSSDLVRGSALDLGEKADHDSQYWRWASSHRRVQASTGEDDVSVI